MTDAPSPAPAAPARVASVDVVRGAVMLVMALDHVRTYLGVRVNPEDPVAAGPALFLTRWTSHFCAPTFVFLAGAGAYLYGRRVGSRRGLAWFLVTRGLFLVALEPTLVHWLWTFSADYQFSIGQVIFSTGVGFVALAALVGLPARAVGASGVAVLLLHNLGDGLDGRLPGAWGAVWDVLHARPAIPLPGGAVFMVVYPPLPWFGVLAAGYGFGTLLEGTDAAARDRRLLALGLALSLAFLALRATDLNRDPHAWRPGPDALTSALTFVNPAAHPPSLQFALMTLGPAIAALGLADRLPRAVAGPLETFGRVPLFYYLLHFLAAHAAAVLICLAYFGRADWLFGPLLPDPPPGATFGLPAVYAVWAAVVLLLYPACRWYAGVKRRHPGGVLSYF